MTYSLTFELHDDYLKAHLVAASIDPQTALAYMTELHDKCVASGHSRLLVIREVPTFLNLSDHFTLAGKSAGILQGVKTAWINPYPDLNRDLEFFCLAANNRGANYQLFLDLLQAEKWLGKEKGMPTVPFFFRPYASIPSRLRRRHYSPVAPRRRKGGFFIKCR
ncbi:MAG TPA: hypothetical protein VGO43_07220 [Pyrinomonadaceae bacterium]|jgi:hypothetical protein|nr:hypothetical protein [Pyrinomonadaceae bacterium]